MGYPIPWDQQTRRQKILAVVDTAATKFLYYDRKESESLPVGELEAAVEAGEISWQEIAAAFASHLPQTPAQPAMPVFVIKAKDRLAVSAVAAYRRLCEESGLTAQAAEVDKALLEIVAWRGRNEDQVQLPNHQHVPAGA